MLTQNFLFGLNLISLGGFFLMGLGMTLVRQQKIGATAGFGLMTGGTALLFLGLYLAPRA